MKHSLPVTILLLTLFLTTQFLGLAILYNYIDQDKSAVENKTVFKELPFGERPPLEEKTSFISVILAIIIGTAFFLLLIKYNWIFILRLWFLLAVVVALTMAFNAFFSPLISFVIALILGSWKLFKPNVWIQNGTELFIYSGLAVIFVPVFNMVSGIILLILISVYDAYAVWKSKHMIALAQSQSKARMFAGLLVPYTLGKSVSEIKTKVKSAAARKSTFRTAILGGGDLGFPLIFAGIVLKEMGVWQSLIIPPCAALGLAVLLWNSQEKKFYPAMPFIAAGCFLGLGIVWLLGIIV